MAFAGMNLVHFSSRICSKKGIICNLELSILTFMEVASHLCHFLNSSSLFAINDMTLHKCRCSYFSFFSFLKIGITWTKSGATIFLWVSNSPLSFWFPKCFTISWSVSEKYIFFYGFFDLQGSERKVILEVKILRYHKYCLHLCVCVTHAKTAYHFYARLVT